MFKMTSFYPELQQLVSEMDCIRAADCD